MNTVKRAMMFLPVALLAFSAAACDEKKTETKPEDPTSKNATTTSADAGVTTTTTTPTQVAINDSDLSTPADFEESAEKSITKANYKAELTSLETDIAKE